VNFLPRAITLDLDDTLWEIAPVIQRAESVLHEWLRMHAPRCATRYSIEKMRGLRDAVAAANPQLAHDFTAQRKLSLAQALAEVDEDPSLAEAAFEAFHAARNTVELYPDVHDALPRLAARAPLAALTNGNADLGRIGLHDNFVFALGAREHGAAKPDAGIFHAACERLGLQPHEVLHVGDDPEHDVLGAHRAGLRTCWINRRGVVWSHRETSPDLNLAHLGALADWLDARHLELATVSVGVCA
jgi:putative hydrolase of the HAD superfamily